MVDNTPPNDILDSFFNLSSSGYTYPEFVDRGMDSPYTAAVDLQAAVAVSQLYQNNTYTYTKECRKIVVGFSTSGIQSLNLPCSYGGIRDLGAQLYVDHYHFDLGAYLKVDSEFKTLLAFLRVAVIGSLDLSSYMTPSILGTTSLGALLYSRYLGSADIFSSIKVMLGMGVMCDLVSFLQTIPPIDLLAFLKVREIRDLYSSIEGVWWKGSLDLGAVFSRIIFKQELQLQAFCTGLKSFSSDTLDLLSSIQPFYFKDLVSNLFAGHFKVSKDLASLLYSIQPIDLLASIQAFASLDLSAYLTQGWAPNELQAYIYPIPPKDLRGFIKGHRGFQQPKDLIAIIGGFNDLNLSAVISAIEFKALQAFINITGNYSDLQALIVPKTINIKRVLLVPLFEHKDLAATINYDCKQSSYSDFSTSMHLIYKKDLTAYIIGWHNGFSDRVVDLKAVINSSNYNVVSSIPISFYGASVPTVTHDVEGFNPTTYKTFNTMTVLGAPSIKELSAYLSCVPSSRDLSSYIKTIPLANYSPTPDWVKPKTREVVINFERFETRWQRFVELMFFTNSDTDFHYFYVSATNKAYKVDKNRTWLIWVTGYDQDPDTIFDKAGVRRKFLFNFSNYDTIDSAVRDMIDRVAEYRKSDLSSNICGVLGNNVDLSAEISIRTQHSWVKHISAQIKCYSADSKNLTATIATS